MRSTSQALRPKRLAHFLVLASTLALAAPSGSLGEAAQRLSIGAVASARDFLAARSPGKRTRAEMSKGKFVRAAPKPRPVVRRPVVKAPVVAAVPPALLFPPPAQSPLFFEDRPFEPAAMDFSALAPGLIEEELACFCTPFLDRPLGSGVIVFGPGGGGTALPPGPGPGPGTGLLPPPGGGGMPPAPGIPEPNTWGMMILGFAAIGTAWRRRRALVRLIVDFGLLRIPYFPPVEVRASALP